MSRNSPPAPSTAERSSAIADTAEVRAILVCQLRQIGDVLLSTPSIELLARHFPKADLHVFTEKKCVPMLEYNPHIHRIWPLDKAGLTLAREYALYLRIAATGFDLVVDFQQLPRCRAVTLLSRARLRLSFPPPWYLRPLYTHWHQPKPAYAAAYKAEVLSPLGIHWHGERPRLYLTENERAAAVERLDALGLRNRPFISIDASHRHVTRRWPASHYAGLIDMLNDALPDYAFFLPYGPGEENDIRTLRDLCRKPENLVIPDAVLPLRDCAACTEHAELQFGNCSSPRHVAVALDVPSLTVLGSTSPGWTFPSPEHTHIAAAQFMDMPCAHCNRNSCDKELACLEKLTPDLVFPRFMEHLRLYGKRGPRPQSA